MSFKNETRFLETIAAFDALNARDPNTVDVLGEAVPKELHDAQSMTRWIDRIYPDASEAVHLAARSQHLCRWEIPRADYPEGKAGYHRWRNTLKKHHAKKSAALLREHGYDEAVLGAVELIHLKKGIKTNPDVQQIEDALCLVFLECQFESYLDKWDEDKMIGILRKTWVKMSETGQRAALQLDLSDSAKTILNKALSA